MIKSIIELAAGMSVGVVMESAAKHVKPRNLGRVGKLAYKTGTVMLGAVITETCLDWGKDKIKQWSKETTNGNSKEEA